jgi:hypothetical protein
MSREGSLRTVLMVADIKAGGSGFHRLVFKVDGGARGGISRVTVLISQDAHRKLVAQMTRARLRPVEPLLLLKTWARWEIAQRIQEHGMAPSSVTITASDLDDFGAYATDLGRTLQVS